MNELKKYKNNAHQSVDMLFKEIENLKDKGIHMNEENKKKINEAVESLNLKKEALQVKMNELTKSSELASEDAKKGFEEAKEALTKAWNQAKSEFDV